MFKALTAASGLAAAFILSLAPISASQAGEVLKVDPAQMVGRWYEVARVPNKLQRGCIDGTSDWTRTASGFAVVQACRKNGELSQWKANAKVADPATNTRLKMSFFGGVVSQDYRVVEHRPDQGWLVLATANGKYLWLMSQKPSLPSAVRSQALIRIRQLGFDVGRLEFPRGG